VALVGLGALAASAAPIHDTFWAHIDEDNLLVDGGGSGWNGGEWIYYDQTNWWNQWFYDDPPAAGHSKTITYDVEIAVGMTVAEAWVAINWSTADYSNPSQPPQPDDEQHIVREVVFHNTFPYGDYASGTIDIPNYNPEWVSVDVRVSSTDRMFVGFSGDIWHECFADPPPVIPEPTTLALLGLGLAAIARRRRRR